jgi:hypothetical protein
VVKLNKSYCQATLEGNTLLTNILLVLEKADEVVHPLSYSTVRFLHPASTSYLLNLSDYGLHKDSAPPKRKHPLAGQGYQGIIWAQR